MIRIQRYVIISLLAVCFGVMIFGWWHVTGQEISSDASKLIAIARLAGIVATGAVLLQLLLMSRASFIENNFDLEEINTFHRYNGYVMVYALIAHVLFLLVGYRMNTGLGWWPQFVQFNTGFEDVLKATIGSVFFFVVAITSAKYVRHRLPYEAWYFLHIIVYASVLLIFGHQIHSGSDIITQEWFKWFWIGMYAAVFACVFYYRFLRQLILYGRHGFVVSRIAQESPNIYSVYISGRGIANYTYRAGQYAHWRFLTADTWVESHPFSFSSVPGSEYLRITYKASGDFTKQLLTYIAPGTRVLIDGPRGSFTANRATTKNVLLIAGGIGVSPLLPIAKVLLANGKNVHVIYSIREQADAVFNTEFLQLKELMGDHFALTHYETGDVNRLTEVTLAPYTRQPEQLTVYICGPETMSRSVHSMLESLGVPPKQILSERFMF